MPAEKPDFARFFLADNACEITAPEPGIKRADLGPGLPEDGVVCRDRQITDEMQNMPAADREACDHGNHRFWKMANLFLQIEDIQARHTVFADITGFPTNALIAAGAKSFPPLPRQDHDTDGGILPANFEGRFEFGDGLRAKGVSDLGAVDRDFCDPLLRFFKQDVFKGMLHAPLRTAIIPNHQ